MHAIPAFGNHLPVKVRFGEGVAATLPDVLGRARRDPGLPDGRRGHRGLQSGGRRAARPRSAAGRAWT